MVEYKYAFNDEDNSVKIEWLNKQWTQRNHPKTTHVWTKEEAESWALEYIQACKDNNDDLIMPSQMTE
jgi:hypothetical protein